MSFSSLCSNSTSFSEDEKPMAVLWGCELNDTTRKCVVEVDDDLLEHLVYLKTVSLGEDADAELHVIAMESKNMTTSLKPMPFVSLRHSILPMICLNAFELVPPVAFILKSGTGPVYLHGEHLIVGDVSDYEPSEDELPPDEGEDDTGQENREEDEEGDGEPDADGAEMEEEDAPKPR